MAQIGDILAKLGRNETLSTAEQQQIRLWGNNTEFNNAFIAGLQNGQADLNVSTIRAIRGDFEFPPSGYGIRVLRDTDVTVTSGPIDGITFESKMYDDYLMWNVSDPTKVYIKRSGRYQVIANCRWGAGSAGYRTLFITVNPLGGGGGSLSSWRYSASTAITNEIADEVSLSTGTYITAAVQQITGADLSLTRVRLSIRLIRAYDSQEDL